MKNQFHRFVLLVCLPLLLPLLFLFQSSSRVEENDCSEIVKLENGLHIPVSCDAWDYVQPAMKFQHLWWNPIHIKQSRPLHIITAHYLARVLKYIGVPEGLSINKNEPILQRKDYVNKRRVQIITEQWHIFLSYIVINLFFIIISLMMFMKIINFIDYPYGIFLYVVLSVTFVFNYLNKSFLFNTHSQVFAIFAPLLTIYYLYLLIYKQESYRRQFHMFCFGLGLMMLFYGSFIYAIPFLIFSELFVYGRSKNLKLNIQRWIFGLFLFALPTLVYMFYLKYFQNVTYYNQEVGANRQFFWALDVFTSNRYSISEYALRFSEFIKTFEASNTIILLTLLYLTIYSCFKKSKNQFVNLNILFSFYLLLFTYLNGAYEPRMTFVFSIPVLMASVFFIHDLIKAKKQEIAIKICLISFMGFWIIYHFNY
jgi:hypothetical protein